jgi:hypothetical protein
MRFPRWLLLAAAAPVALAGCNSFGEAMTAHTDVVARAGGQEFKVEDAAQLLALNPDIPAEAPIVRMLADLWVDYTLLALAAAEDTTLAVVNMEKFTQEAREQQLIWKLREQVVQVDTAFTDEQLQQRWATDGPGAEIRARHILLRIPADAQPAQREELRQQAEALRARAAGGEDFAALAREHSQDPGSAARGGDLDYFGRGRMVAPFEEAAFALEPGQVSQVVESPFGYHVIKVEDRRQPTIGDEREPFRQHLIEMAVQQAEQTYLDSLSAAADVQIRPGGLAVVRELAKQPDVSLRGRQANREIATYSGGSFTSGTFATFIRAQPPHVQSAFAGATDEQLEGVVQQMVRKEVLVQEAQRRGIALSADEEREIRDEARDMIRQVLQISGFARQNGQARDAQVISAHVRELLQGALRGERQLVPLGPLGLALREAYPAEVNQNAFSQVLQRVEQLRAQQAPAEGLPQQGMPPHQQPQVEPAPAPAQP